MYPSFLLCIALAAGQAEPSSDSSSEPYAPAAAPADDGLLMRCLRETCFGGWLDDHKLKISGWTEMSFTASSARFDQLPMGFNYRANEFLLQQNWLRLEKPVDPTAAHPTFGFRGDSILPGSDYRFTIARGLFDGQLTANDGEPNTYGIDPVQFYLQAYFPHIGQGLDVKFGRFFAQFGVESIDATLNALPSRSYTFIYDPFTHTGLLTTLKLDETWSVQNGIVTGSDVFIDPAARPTYLGSLQYAPANGRDKVLLSVIVGPGQFDGREQFNHVQIFDLVCTHKFSDRFSYSLEALYGFQTDVPDLGAVNWFGIVHYLNWTLNARCGSTLRLEFFDDIDGERTGFKGLYTAAAAGLSYKPCQPLLLRTELRYDYNDASRPFEGSKDLFTACMDVILRW